MRAGSHFQAGARLLAHTFHKVDGSGIIHGPSDRAVQSTSKKYRHPLGGILPLRARAAAWVAVFFGCALYGAIAVPMDDAASVNFVKRVSEETP